jgi:hypothetical protein
VRHLKKVDFSDIKASEWRSHIKSSTIDIVILLQKMSRMRRKTNDSNRFIFTVLEGIPVLDEIYDYPWKVIATASFHWH